MDENQFQVIPLDEGPNSSYRRSVHRVFYGLMSIAGIFVVSGLIWFFWGHPVSFSDNNVEFNIEASKEVPSGERVNYVVKFKNKNAQALQDVGLVFNYPADSVVIKEGETAQFLTEDIKIGEVVAGGEGQYEFPAYLVGDKGEIKKARAKLTFTPEQVYSTFEKETEAVTNISALDVAVTLVAPPHAVSGEPIAYIFDYRNESSKDLENLRASFTYPDGFTPTRFNPPTIAGNNTWGIKMIKPGEGDRITVEGVLRGTERENKSVAVTLQRTVEGVTIAYEKAMAVTTISTPPLAVAVSVNGQTSYVAQLGEALNYQIKFTNNSEVDLTGLTITAKLNGSMFEVSNVRTNGFFDAGTRVITWNASSSSLLNRLAPEQYGVVDFTINLKNSFPPSGLGAKDLVVKAGVRVETLTIPPGFYGEVLTAQAEAVAKIKSLPSFEQTIQYVSDNESGLADSGPVPPKNGSKTTYTVVWRLGNTAGDIAKTRMRVVLPAGVSWENKTRVGGQQPPLTFKNSSREVVWDVGVLPAGTGSTAPKYEAWFQISITPSAAQVGTAPILVRDLSLEGEDTVTKQVFVLRGKDLTTNDLADRPNQGVVGE